MKRINLSFLLIGVLGMFPCYAQSINLTDMLDSESLSSILDYPGNFTHHEEERICERMVNELTLDELESAACTSYAYWMTSPLIENKDHLYIERRMRAAKKEARRHLAAERGNFESAMIRLRETCKIRKDKKLDLLRLFVVENANDFITVKEDENLLRQWKSQLQQEMNRQATWVSGDEKTQQAILHRFPRSTTEVDKEAYDLLIYYATERALAVSEWLSKGHIETATLVLHFENYQSENMPPIGVVRTSLTDLQMIYPERITKILVLDPPRWLRLTYGVVSVFLSKHTREKVQMISGNEAHRMELGICSELTNTIEMNDAHFLMTFPATRINPTTMDPGSKECASIGMDP